MAAVKKKAKKKKPATETDVDLTLDLFAPGIVANHDHDVAGARRQLQVHELQLPGRHALGADQGAVHVELDLRRGLEPPTQ